MGRGLMTWVFLIGLMIILFAFLSSGEKGKQIETWSSFLNTVSTPNKIVDNRVDIGPNRITARIAEGSIGYSDGELIYFNYHLGDSSDYIDKLEEKGVIYANVDTETKIWKQILFSFGPIILVILLIWFFISRSMRNAGGGPGGMLGNFGKSKHRLSNKDAIEVTFNDVAGIDEAKEEVTEIVEFLKNPKRFQRLGGRIPRGVLLVGPPGCGKTLLARAIAGEADVPFFSISGSDFVEMFVGVGASRVRDLFKQAKDNSPCIIFLDEIDAVGRRRGGGFTTGGHDEREQTLNAILVEMDGFNATDQIIVIAATNRSDVLDPALTRPGRFDRQVQVPLPDLFGRSQILEVHSKKVKTGPDVNLERLGRGTPMFSGADLAAVINEAAIIATLAHKDHVEMEDLEEARDKIRFGRARKSRRIEELERGRHCLPRSWPYRRTSSDGTCRSSPQGDHHSTWPITRCHVLAFPKRTATDSAPDISETRFAFSAGVELRSNVRPVRSPLAHRWTFKWPRNTPAAWSLNGECLTNWDSLTTRVLIPVKCTSQKRTTHQKQRI